MRLRLTIEVDLPEATLPARLLQKKFGETIMENFRTLQHNIPGEIVFLSSEVISAGDTMFNIRSKI